MCCVGSVVSFIMHFLSKIFKFYIFNGLKARFFFPYIKSSSYTFLSTCLHQSKFYKRKKMTFSYFGKVLAKTRFLRDLYRDQCLCRYDHAHCCSMHNAISTFLKSIVTYRNSASLLEKNLRKLKIQWIFVDGVEWKSNIFDFSIKNDFQSTPSTNTVIIEFSFFADFFLSLHKLPI